MNRNYIDIAGKTFGRWAVLAPSGSKDDGKTWQCVCACGHRRVVRGKDLRSGRSTSCGCASRERSTKHGRKNSPEYSSWQAMIARCTRPSHGAYHRYGGRGIKICDRWRHSFEDFFADMGPRPEGLTLDRIDTNGHYEPGNCRWATRAEQSRNQRTNVLLSAFGKTMCAAAWAKEIGVTRTCIWLRLRRGWSVEKALSARPATGASA